MRGLVENSVDSKVLPWDQDYIFCFLGPSDDEMTPTRFDFFSVSSKILFETVKSNSLPAGDYYISQIFKQ